MWTNLTAQEKLKKLLEEVHEGKYGTKNRATLVLKLMDLIESYATDSKGTPPETDERCIYETLLL